MASQSYYEILGITRDAGEAEIKKAYRELARKYHPDVCKEKGAEERFKEINEAYGVLSDTQKKARYDQMGHEQFTSASKGQQGGAGGYGFNADFSGFGGFGDIFDIFGGQFSGTRYRGPRSGNDLLMKIQVSLEDVVSGADREIEVHHTEACPSCGGTGSETKKLRTCPRCGGSGQVQQVSQTVFGQFMRMGTCSECKGRGRIPERQCPSCRGSGHTRMKRKVSIHIPPGVDTGMRLRMEGYGEAGDYGAPNGDLFIEIFVRPHQKFSRTGDNLETSVEITPAQAVLGSVEEIETIDHRHLDLTIPPGIQHNTALKVSGEGIKRKTRPGDLLVRVRIAVPKQPTEEEAELYQQILDLEGKRRSGGKKGIFSGLRSRKK